MERLRDFLKKVPIFWSNYNPDLWTTFVLVFFLCSTSLLVPNNLMYYSDLIKTYSQIKLNCWKGGLVKSNLFQTVHSKILWFSFNYSKPGNFRYIILYIEWDKNANLFIKSNWIFFISSVNYWIILKQKKCFTSLSEIFIRIKKVTIPYGIKHI